MKLSVIHNPRFSVARLMGLIAIVGFILGGARWIDAMRPKVAQRRAMARKHETEIKRWKEMTGWVDKPEVELVIRPNESRDSPNPDPRHPARYFWLEFYVVALPRTEVAREFVRRHRDDILALCRERVEYHERMRRKWLRAAWFPFMLVEPDGPKPPIDGAVVGAEISSGNY